MLLPAKLIKILPGVLVLMISLTGMPVQAVDKTFENVCSDCHTGGLKGWLSGAPNVYKKSQWSEYIERDSLERMQEIVLLGSDDHKRKGGCKPCSDEDIIRAIEYMLSLVK